MDTATINFELEHYVGERLTTNSREAFRRLYLRSVARFTGPALADYFDHLRRLAITYASISHRLKTPLCHIESPLFLSSLTLFIAGIVVMANGGFSTVIAGATSASIVGMIHCGRRIMELRRLYGVEEAVFLELAETLQGEVSSWEGQPA